MSVSLNSGTGVVTVVGRGQAYGEDAPAQPAAADAVTAKVSGSQFVVTLNGATSSFAAKQVKRLVVDLRTGLSDRLRIDPSVKVPAEVSYLGQGSTAAGNPFADLTAGSGPTTFLLAGSNAVVRGGPAADTFYIGAAYSASGTNNVGTHFRLFGGAGNDAMRVTGGAYNVAFDGGTGNDTLDFSATQGGLVFRDGRVGEAEPRNPGGAIPPPTIQKGKLDNTYTGVDTFLGSRADDFIYGTDGANYIDGKGGNDYIRGGKGNDVLVGGAGADALYGDDGDDQFFSQDKTKDFLSGGAGKDKWRGDASDVLNSVETKF